MILVIGAFASTELLVSREVPFDHLEQPVERKLGGPVSLIHRNYLQLIGVQSFYHLQRRI